ncbi:MAG TPA: hypothetical protein VFN67_36930 [Polyangiales bacterium]|nr:hypothetical protein [Polyangiales bacterium]
MKRQRFLNLVLLTAATGFAACSGDDDDDEKTSGAEMLDGGAEAPRAGKGGSGSAGKGGAGGSKASTDEGSSEGGSGGKPAAGGGKGGAKSEPAAGSGGSPGSEEDAGIDIPVYPAVEKAADSVITEANDLRGLTFSKSGKIWASGHTDADPMNRKLVLARFNADATPDTSFDGDGYLIYDAVMGDEQSLGLVELANGDVVVQANVSDGRGGAPIVDTAGAADGVRANGSNIVLLRFTSEGKLVESFGQGGVAQLQLGWAPEDDASWPAPTYNSMAAMENQKYSGPGYPTDQAWGVLLDASGEEEKLVINAFGPPKKVDADQRYDNDRYVIRVLASSGAFDAAFNGGTPYTFNTKGTLSDGARRAFVEADGSIVSSGYTNFGMNLGNHVVLLRLKPDGTPDTSFGFGAVDQPGIATFNPFVDNGGVAECYAVKRQENGRYITTGYGRATAANMTSKFGYATTDGVDLVSFAVKPDGTGVDTSWGIEGTRAIQSEEKGLTGTEDRGRDLVVLKDGRTVQVGRYGVGPAVFVVTPDGVLDPSSGDKGVISYTPFGGMTTSHFFAVALSADGKQIVTATNNHAEGVLLAVLKVAE